MTPYQKHVAEWQDCRRCPLCEGRAQVVFARGKIPCDVLFVGEAPGTSEDAIGAPFVGPAGELLDQMLNEIGILDEEGQPLGAHSFRLCFYNLVGCFPREEKKTGDHRPPPESIRQCSLRLVQFVQIAKPRMIVTVGETAEEWCPIFLSQWPNSWAHITHPAAILRKHPVQRDAMIHATIDALSVAFEMLTVKE